jgi:hypothetical protein
MSSLREYLNLKATTTNERKVMRAILTDKLVKMNYSTEGSKVEFILEDNQTEFSYCENLYEAEKHYQECVKKVADGSRILELQG